MCDLLEMSPREQQQYLLEKKQELEQRLEGGGTHEDLTELARIIAALVDLRNHFLHEAMLRTMWEAEEASAPLIAEAWAKSDAHYAEHRAYALALLPRWHQLLVRLHLVRIPDWAFEQAAYHDHYE